MSIGLFAQYTPNVDTKELGLGLRKVGDKVDVLFRVKSNAFNRSVNYDTSRIYIITFEVEGSTDGNSLPYLSVNASLANYGIDISADRFKSEFGVSLLNVDYKRDINIDIDQMYQLNVLGVNYSASVEVGSKRNVRLFAHAASSFLGVLFGAEDSLGNLDINQNTEDLGLNGSRSYNVELGVEIEKKYKISVGVNGQRMQTLGESYFSHEQCFYNNGSNSNFNNFNNNQFQNGQYFPPGYYCTDVYGVDYKQFWSYQERFLKVVVNLFENENSSTSIYAKYAKRTYEYQGVESSSAKTSRTHVEVGVIHKFGKKKKKKKVKDLY